MQQEIARTESIEITYREAVRAALRDALKPRQARFPDG